MSLITSLSSPQSALAAVNFRPHGHKHGSHVESSGSDSSTDTAAQVPVGTAQNLFGSLLQSLQQVVGVQPSTTAAGNGAAAGVASTSLSTGQPTSALAPVAETTASPVASAATAASTPAASTKAATAASTPTASTVAQSASTLLQNYLNNLSQVLQANGSQIAKTAGANVHINV